MALYNSLTSAAFTTNQKVATVSVKVPGVFSLLSDGTKDPTQALNGYIAANGIASGRYLNKVEVMVDSGTAGDYLSDLYVQDMDRIIPPPLQTIFPTYPILASFMDAHVELPLESKLYLFPNRMTQIDHIGDRPNFIPSGMYITGTFNSALLDGNIETTVRFNFFWSKYIPES